MITVTYNKFNTEIQEAKVAITADFTQTYTVVEQPISSTDPTLVKVLNIVYEDVTTGTQTTQALTAEQIKEMQLLLNQLTRQLVVK